MDLNVCSITHLLYSTPRILKVQSWERRFKYEKFVEIKDGINDNNKIIFSIFCAMN